MCGRGRCPNGIPLRNIGPMGSALSYVSGTAYVGRAHCVVEDASGCADACTASAVVADVAEDCPVSVASSRDTVVMAVGSGCACWAD